MAVYGGETKLPHPPRLISNSLANRSARGPNRIVKRVNVVDLQISKVRMIAELRRMKRVGTLCGPDGAIAGSIKQETRVWDRMDSETKNVTVERGRRLQIGNGDDKT